MQWRPGQLPDKLTVMRYGEFRDAIAGALRRRAGGMTWAQLRDGLGLAYERPCPEWTARLEREIGLRRTKADGGRALVWTTTSTRRRSNGHR
jgi:hypothetical protein